LIRTLNSLHDGHREELVDIIRAGVFTPENEKRIVSLCKEHGGLEVAGNAIHNHLDRAGEAIARFENEGEARLLLENVVLDLKAYADIQLAEFGEFSK